MPRASLSGSGRTPGVNVRLPIEAIEAVDTLAEDVGVSRAEWIREMTYRELERQGVTVAAWAPLRWQEASA